LVYDEGLEEAGRTLKHEFVEVRRVSAGPGG
jgi:hypothetical protein